MSIYVIKSCLSNSNIQSKVLSILLFITQQSNNEIKVSCCYDEHVGKDMLRNVTLFHLYVYIIYNAYHRISNNRAKTGILAKIWI